jgi:hypothetical protein
MIIHIEIYHRLVKLVYNEVLEHYGIDGSDDYLYVFDSQLKTCDSKFFCCNMVINYERT